MNNFSKIVKQTRKSQGMSLRKFADAISYPDVYSISYQSIKNWENNKHEPLLSDIVQIGWLYPEGSWQHKFSEDCYSAIMNEWRSRIPEPA